MEKIAEQIVQFEVVLTEEIIEATKIAFLDTINALIMGMQEPEIRRLSRILALQNSGAGTVDLIGQTNKLPLTDMAFILGAASVAVELDEGNQWSKGHPAVHVFPLLLLHAQQQTNYSGRQFILDFVKCYEIATYFGRITTLKPSLHAHGTWGVLGSAATFGVLNQVNANEMAKLLNIAATFASPTQWSAAIEGATIRNIYMSESIVGGIRAWQLMQAGIEAPRGNAQAIFSDILGTEFDVTKPFFEERMAIELNYYKFHAFCRYVHVPIEVFQYLMDSHVINIEEIERVDVFTYARAATLANQSPTNRLGSKFSIPFAIAAWAHTKRTDHGVFTERFIHDDQICALAERVFVKHDPIFDENYPNIMPAKVQIKLKDGTTFVHEQNVAKGGPSEKVTLEQITLKFFENTENILSKESQLTIVDFVVHLEKAVHIGDLISKVNNGLKEEAR